MINMNEHEKELIDRLEREHSLTEEEYARLIDGRTDEARQYIAKKADAVRQAIYGRDIFTRGLIEISSICKNNCLYCGIRRGNKNAQRYRLLPEDIYACAESGYSLGFRTFVLQGGEDPYFTDDVLTAIVSTLRERFPDCAITLSMGERKRESYEALYRAGADRYLLRHETADADHYRMLHPPEMSFEHRMACLQALKEIGYQTGAGFMVGSPGQTSRTLARDLKFIETFKPDMCGIGPFIPHHDTEFRDCPAGDLYLTLFLLSVIRLILPYVLLPATTALGTIHPLGREMGIQAGANVVMPNLSPVDVRKKYELYDNKICTGEEAAECRGCLARRFSAIGFNLAVSRGDVKR